MSAFRVEDDKSYPFHAALYHACCADCGSGLSWEAAFDADGTNYYAECCDKKYVMFPDTVSISVETT